MCTFYGLRNGLMKQPIFVLGNTRNAGYILKKFSSFKVLIIGQLVSIGLTIVAVLFAGAWSPIIIALTSIPYGITTIALISLMHAEFSDKQRATMGSINSLLGNIFFAIFAYTFGLAADYLGTTSPIVITETLSLSVIYLYWMLFKNHKKEHMFPQTKHG